VVNFDHVSNTDNLTLVINSEFVGRSSPDEYAPTALDAPTQAVGAAHFRCANSHTASSAQTKTISPIVSVSSNMEIPSWWRSSSYGSHCSSRLECSLAAPSSGGWSHDWPAITSGVEHVAGQLQRRYYARW